MENFIEDYNYSNCFWMKSDVLYSHAKSKFDEYQSIGLIFKAFSNGIKLICEYLPKFFTLYKPVDSQSTLNNGVLVLFNIINQMTNSFENLYNDIVRLSKNIEEKKIPYKSKKNIINLCEEAHTKFKTDIGKLKKQKALYYDSVNKAIESFLISNLKNNFNYKEDTELKNKIEFAKIKRKEYKNQIGIVEKSREDYMDIQGNIFADEEEFELQCTNELKEYLLKFINIIKNFTIKINLNEEEMKKINEIDGNKDNKTFAKKNKSLIRSPKRYLFKEYNKNINDYIENFIYLKPELKNKSPDELKVIKNKLSENYKNFLSKIIKEKPDENNKILNITKNLRENNLNEKEFNYLINKFQERYDQFLKWKKEKVGDQNYKKIGIEWEDRFCYIKIFLEYLNKTRGGNTELNELNYNFLCEAMKKILELNTNENIEYNLCDLILILSLSYYKIDFNYQNNKKYVNEIIKTCSILKKQGFWVGYVKFKIEEEIKLKYKLKTILKTDYLSKGELNTNSVNYKLISVLYSMMQFIPDSNLINKIVSDIFKYFNISKENRKIIIETMDNKDIVFNKELLLNEE